MSPMGAQVNEGAQRLAWQFWEQHSQSAPHELPSVMQPPGTRASQVPPAQFWVQHSALSVQPPPVEVHRVASQTPPTQFRVQQSVGTVHDQPAGPQVPVEQVFVLWSHENEQQ